MNRFILAIIDTGAAHFAELVAGDRHREKAHWTSGILSITFVAISRFALGRANIVVCPQFHQCQAGKNPPEITHRAEVATPDLSFEDEIQENGC